MSGIVEWFASKAGAALLCVLSAALVLGVPFGIGYGVGASRWKAKEQALEAQYRAADAQAKARARAQEQSQASQLAAITTKYEQDKADAKAQSDAVVAGLRAGAVKLQKRWSGCAAVPAAAGSAAEVDGGADDRAESAGRIIAAADACDAQVMALQAVLQAERK